MEHPLRRIKLYVDPKGWCPFDDWLDELSRKHRAAVQIRIDRLETGNPGKGRSLGGGLMEMKIDVGPGIRVYYGLMGPIIVILLCGGDKSTQNKDIARAHFYLEDFKRRML